jgi:DNA-binding MarR family transcriptional regulator
MVSTRPRGLAVEDAARVLLLLMPRLVGRAKRLPMPRALSNLDLAPRHLAMLAHLEYDGPISVNELAARLEVAPTTVSLMVSTLAEAGVVERASDPADRRRRIVRIAPAYTAAIAEWLSPSASAWRRVMAELSPEQRGTVVGALRAYEAELDRKAVARRRR